ncbi:MAG TPA: lysine--tRNA ligase [Anaerolineae bacterium]|nr:lysine--tRNA ligase [Anaerolineae bacterium]HQH38440.1 lysine--tRNA ligase [Anaerolineae bacterium]
MELNELERQRVEKLEKLQEAGISPYPHRTYRTHTAQAVLAAGEEAERTGSIAATATVAGRLVSIRLMGKVAFAHIEDESGKLQLFIRQNELGDENYTLFKKTFDIGDFVEASGAIVRTRTGEISIQVNALRMLAKAITPLPIPKEYEKADGHLTRYSAFSDVEERYRQRYADLAVNPQVRETFRIRSRTISALRTWLDEHGYLEVETPVLQPIYGGAAARPFITYHNQLKSNLYLRISFELYLKRLLVGMYERVYEIGRDFRNEGVSFKHNPEFTQLEFYCAYTDLFGVMETVEQMISYAARQVLGTTAITYQENTIDLTPPWQRMTLRDLIYAHTGIDYVALPDAEALRTAMRQRGYDAAGNATWGHLVDNLLSVAEPTLIQPIFIHDYPVEISPLAKQKPDDPTHVERFELFIGGIETGNAFTELNDPFEQERRFYQQGREYEAGDEEAHPMDEDYLRAMKYGMPPNGGFGMGIDRLVMLFSDQRSIRDVLLYPHLRPRDPS